MKRTEMVVEKALFEALSKVALGVMVNGRISRLASQSKLTKKYNQLAGIDFQQLRDAEAFDDNIEELTATVLGLMPPLKKEVKPIYDETIKQRLEWAKPKDAKPKASF